MGTEDDTIIQKIKVLKIDIDIIKLNNIKNKEEIIIKKFGEYDEELTKKVLLKTIKRSSLDITYNKSKIIIKNYNIKNINKKKYFKLCEKDIRLNNDPDIYYDKLFINWIDYLSIDRNNYYEFILCKEKINEYLTKNKELKKNYLNLEYICKELCKLDNKFPPKDLWIEYYFIHNITSLNDIIMIPKIRKNNGSKE